MDQIISCCGVVCSECEYYPNDCEGCAAIEGEPFWLEFTDRAVCGIYECCVGQNKRRHCGGCKELPCARYEGNDPTKSEAENQADHEKQMEVLRRLCKEDEKGA